MAFVAHCTAVFGGRADHLDPVRSSHRHYVKRSPRLRHVAKHIPMTMSTGDAQTGVSEAAAPGWAEHNLNANFCVMKDSEGKLLSEIASSDCQILQGIGDKSKELIDALGVKTVKDLAEYKYYRIAKAIGVLASLEEKGGRKKESVMNVDLAVDVTYEKSSFATILAAPVSALQGLSERAEALLAELNVGTVRDLASFKYCQRAEAVVTLGEFENKKSFAERKAERAAKRLRVE